MKEEEEKDDCLKTMGLVAGLVLMAPFAIVIGAAKMLLGKD